MKTMTCGLINVSLGQQLVALLLVGSGRSIMSRSEYERIRSIMAICSVKLPGWAAVRALREKLKNRFSFNLSKNNSPLGTPCFSLRVRDIITQVGLAQFNSRFCY